MRRHLLAAALIASSVAIVGTAPAYAAPAAPTLSNLSTSVAGHVTGTVTAGPDAESVWVCWHDCQINTGNTDGGWVPLGDVDPEKQTRSVRFDLPTWGFADGNVSARACPTSPGLDQCLDRSEITTSEVMAATDVIPTVTWGSDTTIGHNSDGSYQAASATVSDPDGGGRLNVLWDYTSPEWGKTKMTVPVDHSGSTPLYVGDGVGTFTLYRCPDYHDFAYRCTYYRDQSSPTTEVDHAQVATNFTVEPISSQSPNSQVTFKTYKQGSWELDWTGSLNNTEVISGSTGGTLTSGGIASFEIPGEGLPEGIINFNGTLSVVDPDFGPYSDRFYGYLVIDRTGPIVGSVVASRTEIHPLAIDALAKYRTTRIQASDTSALDADEHVEIRNSSGTQVRMLEADYQGGPAKALWDGRNDAGAVVPAGSYSIAFVDSYGNRSIARRTVTVSSTRGVLKVFKKTVSAAGSKQDKYVGRCSTLKSPASRGWSGSLGYFANTRCGSTTSAASAVGTVNAIRIPSAVGYNNLRIDTYGGAARGWRSSASSAYFNQSTLKWTTFRTVRGGLGTHTGTIVPLEQYVDAGRWVVWEFGTSNFNRYDVKSFTVVARYYVWQ
jgi:hypothetical protein